MPTRFERWMRSNDLGDHRAHAQQQRALGGPVARRARAVLLSGDDHERHAPAAVRPSTRRRSSTGFAPGSVAVQPPSVPGASSLRRRMFGERAAHHHFVIAAAGAVRIEVRRSHAVRDQPLAGGTRRRNRAGRRDVVGGDRVAEHRQHARARIGRTPGGSSVMPSKNGGFFTYVESSAPRIEVARRRPAAPSTARRRRTRSRTAWGTSRSSRRRGSCPALPSGDGQMSRRNTGPSVPMPSGSVAKSMSIRPASAYATTSGGDAR